MSHELLDLNEKVTHTCILEAALNEIKVEMTEYGEQYGSEFRLRGLSQTID
jgi:hypothetical protein